MKPLLRRILVAALLMTAPACAVRGRAIYVVDVAPPPVPAAVIVAPRPGWVWIDGRWDWVDAQWRWRPGYWVRERPGHVWVPGAWVQVGTRWHWRGGRWDTRRPHVHPTPPPRRRVQDHR